MRPCMLQFTYMEQDTKTGLTFIKKALKSKNQWYKRIGIVLLLDYYINDDYIDYILNTFETYNSDEYYVIMAIAWLLSICYIKYPDKTIKLLKKKVLKKEIQNKTIQKIRESNRVSKDIKQEILKWRI